MTQSPDLNGTALVHGGVDALRYDGHTDDPWEVAGVLKRLMPANVRVLDVGCGTGSVAVVANRGKTNQVLAIEPDRERSRLARERGLEVYETFLSRAFIDEHGPFDVVMSSDVLEHIPSPADTLALFHEALKPGGVILISVPNVGHWSVRLNLLRGRFDYEPTGIMDVTHLRWFTGSTIRSLVEECGFTVVDYASTAGTTLPVYGRSLTRVVPDRLRNAIVKRLSRAVPGAFACQHVILARKN